MNSTMMLTMFAKSGRTIPSVTFRSRARPGFMAACIDMSVKDTK